jgi:MFS transporter, SP family, inositol transporter
MTGSEALQALDDAPTTRAHWRWTFLTATGNYLDAGSIVAGAVALPLWAPHFALTSGTVGLIGGFSSNGISGGIGALVGGWLGDKYGRRTIYAWDLLIYIAGALVIIFASGAAMLIAGYVLIGLAVGADIPNSLTLLAEFSPRRKRSRLLGFGPVMWYLGPLVAVILAVALNGLGLLAVKIIFAQLAVVALVTWFLRRKMTESPRWAGLRGKQDEVGAALTELGAGGTRASAASPGAGTGRAQPRLGLGAQLRALRGTGVFPALGFLVVLYTVWNVPAGTYGFFFPYLLKTVGARSTFAADYLDMVLYGVGIVTLGVYMMIGDRVNRRLHFAVFSAVAAIGFLLFLVLPVTNEGTVYANILLMGIGGFSVTYHIATVWQAEVLPTRVRATGMGLSVAVARVVLGIWSIYLPSITASLGFRPVALMLALMYVFIMVWGGVFGPSSTQGMALEDIRYSFRRHAPSPGAGRGQAIDTERRRAAR